MEKILILEVHPQEQHRVVNEFDVTYKNLYNEHVPSWLSRIIRKTPFISENFLYVGGKDFFDKFAWIVAWDTSINVKTLQWFKKSHLENKVMLVYTNKIGKRERKLYRKAKKLGGVQQCTYNLSDVKEFSIHYIPQVWDKERLLRLLPMKNEIVEWDIIFVGAAKNRYNEIFGIEDVAKEMHLRTNFWVYAEQKLERTQQTRKSYSAYLDEANRSNAILDIVGAENWGLTWRPLEALFLRKKLITNYADIISYDFYDNYRENIYILDGNNTQGIVDFIKKPYKLCEVNLQSYTYEGWLSALKALRNSVCEDLNEKLSC